MITSALLSLVLFGQLEMGSELEAGALDPLPAADVGTIVPKPARRKSQETSAQRIVRLEKRAEATARIAAAKAERRKLVTERAQGRAYARRARLASRYRPTCGQQLQALYGRGLASHASLWRPPPPPRGGNGC